MATNAFWSGLFGLVGRGLDLVASLVRRRQPTEEQPVADDAAGRTGTAAGAAAHEAGHIVEKGKSSGTNN